MRNRANSGFSLLELMIVTGILLVIFGAVFSSLVSSQKAFDAEQANAEANANARFALNRIKEIIESSGNNPGQVASINDQTGGIVSLYSSVTGFNFLPGPFAGIIGGKINILDTTVAGSTCTPKVAQTFCDGVAIDLQSDLTGDGTTSDIITPLLGPIFGQNIITSEHVQIALDRSAIAGGLNKDEVYLVDMNKIDLLTGKITRIPVAQFIVDLKFNLSIPENSVTITVTARSNRAIAVENIYERRFRYATLTTRVRIRNMNNNVVRSFNLFGSSSRLEAYL